jgi:hypothetical protein
VRLAVDHQRAHAADAFAAVAVEDDRFLALVDEALVEHVHQLEERCLVTDRVDLEGLEVPGVGRPVLPPDRQRDVGQVRGHL